MEAPPKNHLDGQSSPYLQQHVNDPVQWYPWGEEALQAAKTQNKPILLSIGYASCHWCHVMAAESFQDIDTAAVMNQHFINIKVDAQERPDLDTVYQTAFQLMHRQPGGWPLTAILTPYQHIPFFIGTYFPKLPVNGMPSFKEVLVETSQFYRQQCNSIEQNHAPLVAALHSLSDFPKQPEDDSMNERPLTIARIQWENDYDEQFGGFGSAPKFPHPGYLLGLIQYWYLSKRYQEEDKAALRMACVSMEKMAASGLYDCIGGGFFRYTVDEKWCTPHFEKMLYDNAALLRLYAEMYHCVSSPQFKAIAEDIVAWLINDNQHHAGAFYASWDADSDGEEGGYYLWQADEVQKILLEHDFTQLEYTQLAAYWGLDSPSNYEQQWHLQVIQPVTQVAARFQTTVVALEALINRARQVLATVQKERTAPQIDDKLMTSWNALTSSALARAGLILQKTGWQKTAYDNLQFIYHHLWDNGDLYTSFKDGQVSEKGFLQDYAYTAEAILTYLQAQWDTDLLDWAVQLANHMIARFEDDLRGGFYMTSHDHENLLFRPKQVSEDGMPSSNGVAAQVLLLLGYLLGDVRYLTAGERAVRMADHLLHENPANHHALLTALQYYLNPPEMIVIRGQGEDLKCWHELAIKHYEPYRFVFAIPTTEQGLPSALGHKNIEGDAGVCAYICQGIQCQKPITTLDDFQKHFVLD